MADDGSEKPKGDRPPGTWTGGGKLASGTKTKTTKPKKGKGGKKK